MSLSYPKGWVIVLSADVAEICTTPNIRSKSPMVPEWKRHAKPIETKLRRWMVSSRHFWHRCGAEMWDIDFHAWLTSSSEIISGEVSSGRCYVEWSLMSKFLIFVMVSRVWVADVLGFHAVSGSSRVMNNQEHESHEWGQCVILLAHSLPWWAKAPSSRVKIRKCSQKGTRLVVDYMADIVRVNLIEPHYPLTN